MVWVKKKYFNRGIDVLIKPLENRGEPRSEKAPRGMRKSESSWFWETTTALKQMVLRSPCTPHICNQLNPWGLLAVTRGTETISAPSLPCKFKTSTSHWQNGNVNSMLARAVKCSFQASSSFYVGEHWGWERVAFFLIAHILHRDKVSEWLQYQHIDLLWVLSPLPFTWFKFKNKWNSTLASLAGMCGRG